MPIIITDETAHAVILTIDNNGNLAFGDGTPINMLTLNGYGIIDSQGYVVHGLGYAAVIPASGSVRVPINQTVQILTIPGQIPIVACDTNYPTTSYDVLNSPGSDPPVYYAQPRTVMAPEHQAFPYSGGFDLRSSAYYSYPDGGGPPDQLPPGFLEGDVCRYRWI